MSTTDFDARAWAASLTLEQKMTAARDLMNALKSNWSITARPEQVAPKHYRKWVIQAGRGWGKGRAACEEVARIALTHPGCTIAVIARKDVQLDTICFNGTEGSSLCEVIPKHLQQRYYSTSGNVHLVLTNGSVIRGFSAERPDGIAGYNLTAWWADELALFTTKNADEVMRQLGMATRKRGTVPRGIISTTPRRVPHMKALIDEAAADPRVIIQRGATLDNAANLSDAFIADQYAKHGGTAWGRQELEGEYLNEVAGALWNDDLIAAARARPVAERFDRILVSVDPSGSATGDATGIVVMGVVVAERTTPAGTVKDGHISVLADFTTDGTAEHRYAQCVAAAMAFGAGTCIYESNFGGDATAAGIRAAWRDVGGSKAMPFTIEDVHATQDKGARAIPVVSVYQQGRVAHAEGLEQLEAELTTWEPGVTPQSPNRLDALVHGVRFLTDKERPKPGVYNPNTVKRSDTPRNPITSRSIDRGRR